MIQFKKIPPGKSVLLLLLFLTTNIHGFLRDQNESRETKKMEHRSNMDLQRLSSRNMPIRTNQVDRVINEKDRNTERLYDRRSFRTGTIQEKSIEQPRTGIRDVNNNRERFSRNVQYTRDNNRRSFESTSQDNRRAVIFANRQYDERVVESRNANRRIDSLNRRNLQSRNPNRRVIDRVIDAELPLPHRQMEMLDRRSVPEFRIQLGRSIRSAERRDQTRVSLERLERSNLRADLFEKRSIERSYENRNVDQRRSSEVRSIADRRYTFEMRSAPEFRVEVRRTVRSVEERQQRPTSLERYERKNTDQRRSSDERITGNRRYSTERLNFRRDRKYSDNVVQDRSVEHRVFTERFERRLTPEPRLEMPRTIRSVDKRDQRRTSLERLERKNIDERRSSDERITGNRRYSTERLNSRRGRKISNNVVQDRSVERRVFTEPRSIRLVDERDQRRTSLERLERSNVDDRRASDFTSNIRYSTDMLNTVENRDRRISNNVVQDRSFERRASTERSDSRPEMRRSICSADARDQRRTSLERLERNNVDERRSSADFTSNRRDSTYRLTTVENRDRRIADNVVQDRSLERRVSTERSNSRIEMQRSIRSLNDRDQRRASLERLEKISIERRSSVARTIPNLRYSTESTNARENRGRRISNRLNADLDRSLGQRMTIKRFERSAPESRVETRISISDERQKLLERSVTERNIGERHRTTANRRYPIETSDNREKPERRISNKRNVDSGRSSERREFTERLENSIFRHNPSQIRDRRISERRDAEIRTLDDRFSKFSSERIDSMNQYETNKINRRVSREDRTKTARDQTYIKQQHVRASRYTTEGKDVFRKNMKIRAYRASTRDQTRRESINVDTAFTEYQAEKRQPIRVRREVARAFLERRENAAERLSDKQRVVDSRRQTNDRVIINRQSRSDSTRYLRDNTYPIKENYRVTERYTPLTDKSRRYLPSLNPENSTEDNVICTWASTAKIILAAFLIGQIFVNSSKANKNRFHNILSLTSFIKEKVH